MLKSNKKFIRNKKKIDYHKKDYSNPFFRRRKRKKNKITILLSWRIKLIIAEVIILLGGIIWFICFSSYFTIGLIDIIGAEKIYAQDIKDLAWKQTNGRRYLLGSQKNLVLFNNNKLVASLNERYFLDGLKIRKKIPNTIIIELKEKIYSVIWRQLDNYYFIDTDGNIINEANPLEIKQKEYPLIDYQGNNEITEKKINGQKENINHVVKLFNELNKIKSLKIERFIIDDEVNTIKVVLAEGTKIFFNTKESLVKQISKLTAVINERLKNDFNKKEYIDLRYGDMVYYK